METAGKIMKVLTSAGFECYIVGGAVRDIIRGVQPTDIDIVTSATPDEIVLLASQQGWSTAAVGAAFGVMLVVAGGRSYELATFRSERYGSDSHRPESVTLGVSLAEDLGRRDFTINAMAIGIDGWLVDLFGGRHDLDAGVIRTVGNAHQRFAEDGLRMFRAARFAARFGFTLERATFDAISPNLGRVAGLSVERVRTEIEKTLLAPYASQGLDIMRMTGLLAATCRNKEQGRVCAVPILPELEHLYLLSQNPKYHNYDAWQHTLAVVDLVPSEATLRWGALLHDVAKGWPGVRTINREGQPSDPGHDKAGANAAAAILARLKVERQVAERVVWLVRQHLSLPAETHKAVLKWLRRLAGGFKSRDQLSAALTQLFYLNEADRLAGHTQPDLAALKAVQAMAERILAEVPFFPAQLNLSGQQIAALLGSGPIVNRFQYNLLERIQAGRLSNSPAALTAALAARVRRMSKQQQR